MSATRENPWLGLLAYSELDHEFFYGRRRETMELHTRVRRETLTVLYGVSGLGKTSLLKAGLFPELRHEDFLPVYIRLRHDVELEAMRQVEGPEAVARRGELAEQVLSELQHAAGETRTECPAPQEGDSLWEYFHRTGHALWSERQKLITPVLVFDQFEEIFTRGEMGAAGAKRVETFIDDLSAVVENRTPPSITAARTAGGAAGYENAPATVRVILSLREDFLPHLGALHRHFPTIRRNEMRLAPFSMAQALEVVERPGSDLLEPGVAEEIVRFVSAAPASVAVSARSTIGEDAASFGAGATDGDEVRPVEPALLSVVLDELNRLREGDGQITRQLLAGQRAEILANFYERAFAGLDPAVRLFVEKELLTPAGDQRDSRSVEDALTRPGVTLALLDSLVDRRLLRYEERAKGARRIELTHDLLCSVVKAERTRRETTEAVAASEAIALGLRTRLRRSRRIAAGFAVLGLLALSTAIVSFVQYRRAEHARRDAQVAKAAAEKAKREAQAASATAVAAAQRATKARAEAEKLIGFMIYDLRDKLSPIGRLDLLDAVYARVLAYYDAFGGEEESPEILHQRSAMLSNEGDLLRARGDLTGALKCYRDALEIDQRMVKQYPNDTDWQRDLSIDYETVGNVLGAQGDLSGALKNYRDEVAIWEKLVKQDPSNADWQSGLSISYEKVGDVLGAQGDLSGALKNYRGEVAIMDKLAKQDPSNADWQHGLEISYEKVGNVLVAQGDLSGALKNYRDEVAILEKLVKQDPSNADWQRGLSIGYEKVGNVLVAQGDLLGALKNYRDKVAILEKLVKQDASNADWQRGLAISYEKVGEVLLAQGDLGGALKNYRDELAIWDKLAKQDPSNADWQHGLEISYEKVGDVLVAQGDLFGALKNYRDELAILEKLVKQDPSNADWQRGLSIGYEKVGNVLVAQGDLLGALKNYRDDLAIAEKLAKQDPSNADWQRDLAISYEKVGDVLLAQGDLNGALKNYRDEVAILEKLVKQDPSNADWQRGLSISYEKVGKVLSAQGDLSGALKSYRDTLAIREKLAKQDPSNAGWQGELAFSYFRTGTTLEQVEPKSKTDAREMLRKGRDILGSLKERIGLTGQQQGWLEEIDSALHEIGG